MTSKFMTTNVYLASTRDFIEKHYNKRIEVRALETVSGYSYRNLQRVFKYKFGETIGVYQQRLKMEKATKLLLYTKENLTVIASEVGFENLAGFSKAFKKWFGISPKQIRDQKATLFQQIEFESASPCIPHPELVYIKPVQVYFQGVFTAYCNDEIEALWSSFLQHGFMPKSSSFYGEIADEMRITPRALCQYHACAKVNGTPKNLPIKTILGGLYARFIHKGSYDTIDETYNQIYKAWILDAKLELDTSSIVEHYIRHDTNTDGKTDFLTAILFPLWK
jgi:AraC family transcriptional regulator